MESRPTTIIPCASCRGTGGHYAPGESPAPCEVCAGRGENVAPWPHVGCAYCEGTGSFQSFNCPVCRGIGVVAPPPGPTRRCEVCRGRAFDPRCGFPCRRCRGRGVVTAGSPPPRSAAGPFLDVTGAEVCVAR
jgi:DnaJ-class molecular chaperone